MTGQWPIIRLGDLVDPKRGITYGIVQPGQHVTDGVPIVRVSDLKGDRVDIGKPMIVSREIEAAYSRTRLKGGELIMSIVGTVGQTAIVEQSLAGWNVARAVAVIPVLADIGAYWIRLSLRGGLAKDHIDARLNTTVQATLNLKDLSNLPIAVPPQAERNAIAATLGALDDKIELNRRMNATLEAMARALFRDWFVDFGPTLAKMAGTAPNLSDDLWSLFPGRLDAEGKPEGWDFQAVIDQADWINGAAYKNMHFSEAPEALPVIKIAELKNGVTGNTQWTATDLGSRYLIDDGELLFSWSGNPDTSIDTFLWSGGKAWLNQHIFAVRENGKRSKPFLHAMLKFLKPDFAELARNKQTTGLGHVTKADMQRMLICTASQQIHQAFDRLITPIFDRAFLLQLESRTLAQTRDLLLPRLMSGELRLAEASETLEAAL